MILLFSIGAVSFNYFASSGVVVGLFSEYAFLGIAAIGATFVILSGGIDLSVGSVVSFTSIFIAALIHKHGLHPLAAALIAISVGTLFGASMGFFIQVFEMPPFMVTLAGMFFMRALGFVVHDQSMSIKHEFYTWISRNAVLEIPGTAIPLRAFLFVGCILIAIVIAHNTKFGRNIYAIGGDEQSAKMMGLPVAPTKIGVYAMAGFCSALAGFVFTLYKQSGDPASAIGMELDAIAAVVIGGTQLSGGVGFVAGTLMGVIILGLIRTLIDFHGNLNSAWTSIMIGLLLLTFIGLQRGVAYLGERAVKSSAAGES
jgi:simple sugar transport system permease protein